MRLTHLSILTVVILSLAACDSRSIPGGGDGGTSNNNNVNGECGSAGDCVIAYKVDQCCGCPVPASPDDLAADPCLIPEGQTEIPALCMIACPAVECPPCASWGRSLACEGGECSWAEGACSQDTQCVAAIRVDNCCLPAFPATNEDIAADPCLVYWPNYWNGIPQECLDRWDPICDLIDCAPQPPWSRAMVCGSDGCDYVPECENRGDCTMLIDTRQCCSCPEPWPASMQGHDPCLVPAGTATPPGCAPATGCENILCGACPPDPQLQCQGQVCTGDWSGGGTP